MNERQRILAAEIHGLLMRGEITLGEAAKRLDAEELKLCESLTIAKFDGEVEPGKEPVEVITIDAQGNRRVRRSGEGD